MQPKTAGSPRLFKIRRNRSWASSAGLGLRLGLWLAPTTLLQAIGAPLVALGAAAMAGLLRMLAWVALSLGLVALGLTGFLVPTDDNQD